MAGFKVKYQVRFEPDNVEIEVPEGTNLMQAAIAAGVHINASCGGGGTCGTCNVLVKQGRVDGRKGNKVSEIEFNKGMRQSCQSTVTSDLVIEVPAGSRL